MQLENIGGGQVSGIRGRWELDQGDVVDHIGKMVQNGEDDGVSTRKWAISNNIHCYVDPGTTGNRQGSEEASGRMIRRLAPCTRHTGHHKLTQVPRLTGPPEVLTKELQCSPGEPGSMSPI